MEELVDEGGPGGCPSELGSGLGRSSALIEQEDVGEVVAEAGRASATDPGTAPGAPTEWAAASVSSATVEYTPLPIT